MWPGQFNVFLSFTLKFIGNFVVKAGSFYPSQLVGFCVIIIQKMTGGTDLKHLIDGAKNGDNNAFDLIYKQFFTPVFRYVYLRIGNKSSAEDISQDVFIKAYNSLSRFELRGDSILPYFFTIARNTIVDYARKKKNAEFSYEFIEVVKDTKENIQETALKKEEFNKAISQISKLSEDQRDAIILKFINGLSNKEIAEILDKNEDAVRQLQSRGLRIARENLSQKI